MEFDINLILVPITLLLLVVYLADKFVLKQHKVAKSNTKLADMAESHLEDKRAAFAKALKAHYDVDNIDYFVPSANTPADVLALHDEYHAAKRKVAETKGEVEGTKELFLVRWAYEFLPILLFLVIVRAFIAEPFNIPSSSMVPTLHTGDFIVVNKAAYGLRLPITHTKILNTGSPKHGDVVVFRYPLNEKRYYIKRVIGLPNDIIRYDNGVLSVNGKTVDTVKQTLTMEDTLVARLYPQVIGSHTLSKEERAALGEQEERDARYYTETLGNHTYTVRYLDGATTNQMAGFLQENSAQTLLSSQGRVWEVKVPADSYFVMGDNRDRSEDSRFWGVVPEANLAGKATYIWMHKDAGLSLPSFGRVGSID